MLERFKRDMFRPINTAAISIMGFFTILWGFWVGNPFWSVFDQADLYSFMTVFMPEWAWGLLAVTVGVTMVYGVLQNSLRKLRGGALVGFYFWLFASLNFFLGDWQNTGGITLLMIALYCGYIALNLHINRKSFEVDQESFAFEKDE
jgi:hypothetical protein